MNKQWIHAIDPAIGHYLAGFADGEGSFNVSVRKREDHTMGWQIVATFNVSQKESYILSQFKKHLGCGRLQERKDGICYFTVSNPVALDEKVIPFFETFPFRSHRKLKNFAIFKRIVEMIMKKEHLTHEGIHRIISLREELNEGKGRTRKYDKQNIHIHKNPQRLHAKPRAFRKER